MLQLRQSCAQSLIAGAFAVFLMTASRQRTRHRARGNALDAGRVHGGDRAGDGPCTSHTFTTPYAGSLPKNVFVQSPEFVTDFWTQLEPEPKRTACVPLTVNDCPSAAICVHVGAGAGAGLGDGDGDGD